MGMVSYPDGTLFMNLMESKSHLISLTDTVYMSTRLKGMQQRSGSHRHNMLQLPTAHTKAVKRRVLSQTVNELPPRRY